MKIRLQEKKHQLFSKIAKQLYKKHSETCVTTWILSIMSWPPQMYKKVTRSSLPLQWFIKGKND